MDEENLYRAPQSAVVEKRSGTDYVYRSPRRLANVVRGMIFGLVPITLCLIAAQSHQWRVLQQIAAHAFASRDEMLATATQSDRIVAVLAGLTGLLSLGTHIPAGMWIYRVACNVRALGARGFDDTPGMSVGWYFVPFLNLARPFRAMEQIWRASTLPQQWQKRTQVPPLLRWWWAAWLISNVISSLSYRLSPPQGSSDIAALIRQTQMSMAAEFSNVVASVVFLVVVLGLTRLQEQQEANPTPMSPSDKSDGMDLSWLDAAPAMSANRD
jgi:hypothetical protein